MHLSNRINDQRRRAARSLMRLLFGASAQPASEPLPSKGIYRILICSMGLTLGNALLLTPLLQELETTWPGAEIDIATRSKLGRVVYRHYASINRIFQLPSHGLGHPLQLLRELRGMRSVHYDLAIDPDPQSQTGRLLLLMARATFTLGFSSPKKSGNVTHAVPVSDAVQSTGQRPVFLLRRALDKAESSVYPLPDIRLDTAERDGGRHSLVRVLSASHVPTSRNVVIGIFANATGPKLLGAAWWTPLLRTLEAVMPDAQIVEIIPIFGRSMLGSRYPAYYSSDLRKLASVLAGLDAYISLDCGLMHLACAARTRTLGVFTTTNADEWGPYGPGNHIIRAYDLPPEAVAHEIAAAIDRTPLRAPVAS
jgi:heptosyltransferase-3